MQPEHDDLVRRLALREPRTAPSDQVNSWAAVALLLAPGSGGEPETLLILRARRKGDPWSGHVALPGGRREQRDLDLEATARRETLEETGIDLSGARALGQLDDLGPTTLHLPPLAVRPFVYGLTERPEVRPNHEVAGHLWTPLTSLRAQRETSRVQAGKRELDVPAVRLGEHVLWGMTLRILDGFLERLP